MPAPIPLIQYQLAYEHEFNSINGNACKLEIYRNSTNKIPLKTIVGQGTNVVISFGQQSDGFFEPIKTKELVLNFWSEAADDYSELFNTDNFGFYCKFYIDSILNFQGWIMPDIHREAFTTTPFEMTIRFGCGLFLLKNNKIECPFKVDKLLAFVQECMAFNDFGFDIIDACNVFEEQFDTLTGSEKRATLKNLFFGYEIIQGQTYYNALQSILSSLLCEMYQYKGKWIIKRADLIDTPGNNIQGVVYSQSTGLIIDTFLEAWRKNITFSTQAPATRIAWIGGGQSIEYSEAPKELTIEVVKDVTENFFVTGNDFDSDCEFNNPQYSFPTPAQIKFFKLQADFNDPTQKDAYRYFNNSFLMSDVYALSMQANAWKFYNDNDCKLSLKCGVTGYMAINEIFYRCTYVASENTIYYFKNLVNIPNNTPIAFAEDFGALKKNTIYYTTNAVYLPADAGTKFKVARQKNGFGLITIGENNSSDLKVNISPPHISFEVNLFKNFTPAGNWTLGNDGNWYSVAATTNKLTVDLFIDASNEAEISQSLKVIELSFFSIMDIPDSGYLYYKCKGVNTYDVFDTYWKNIQFIIRKSQGNSIELPLETTTQTTTIAQQQKETYEHKLLFPDIPEYTNPHLIYRNYLHSVSIPQQTAAWSLTVSNFDYTLLELTELILKRQLNRRRAYLNGTITAQLDILHKFLREKNYNNFYFKPIFINFNPKMETYTGGWMEIYFPFEIDPVTGSSFDNSFQQSSFD
jgi:hypothetical protein